MATAEEASEGRQEVVSDSPNAGEGRLDLRVIDEVGSI